MTQPPGIAKHSSCPCNSLPAVEVRKILDNADIFILAQTKEFNEPGGVYWQYKTLKRYREDMNLLGEDAIITRFGSGPCQNCYPDPSKHNGDCRDKDNQVCAMESMGFPLRS